MRIEQLMKEAGFKFDPTNSGTRGDYVIDSYIPKAALTRAGISGLIDIHIDCTGKGVLFSANHRLTRVGGVTIKGTIRPTKDEDKFVALLSAALKQI